MTTKLQISGHRFNTDRVTSGFIRRNEKDQESPTRKLNAAAGIGSTFLVISLIAGFMMNRMKPATEKPASAIMMSKEGGLYIMFDGQIHQATNLASARLITRKPQDANIVSDNVLTRSPHGFMMGIPAAPNNLAVWSDTTSVFGLCDSIDTTNGLSLEKTGNTTLSVIAGAASYGTYSPLDNRAILVRSSDDLSRLWMLYGSTRAEVGTRDFATQSALGLTPEMVAAAPVIDSGFIDSIPPSPIFTVPIIAGRGKMSSVLKGRTIGTVATIATSQNVRLHYLILDRGVMRIGNVLAQMLLNTGSSQEMFADASEITSLPETSDFDTSRFPENSPDFVRPATMCMRWTRGAGDTAPTIVLSASEGVPVTSAAREDMLKTLPGTGAIVRADDIYTPPGRGWYVRVTDDGYTNTSAEQIYFIDDTGTRYSIGIDQVGQDGTKRTYDKTVAALGLTSDPLPIPWSILRAFPQGSSLNFQDALTMYDSMHNAIPGKMVSQDG